jgi:hypothetical protein
VIKGIKLSEGIEEGKDEGGGDGGGDGGWIFEKVRL